MFKTAVCRGHIYAAPRRHGPPPPLRAISLPCAVLKHNIAFKLEEEDGCDVDDGAIDLTSPTGGTESPDETQQDEIAADPESKPAPKSAAPAPPGPSVHHRRAVSATAFKSAPAAPALSMTSSPALLLKRQLKRQQWRRSSLSVTGAEAVAAAAKAQAAAEEELSGWGNDSPRARLSRSLSSSQASASSGWSGAATATGAGCAKVTRSSLRRRSRANSTSSPLPLLDTSVSLPIGTTADNASGSWSTRSAGSGGLARPDFRRQGSFTNSAERLRSRSSSEIPSAYGGPPLSRSQRMPLGWGHAWEMKDRPTSLPSGLALEGARAGGAGDPAGVPSVGGDPGVGWVLRAPSAPIVRHRSHSFASGKAGVALPRSSSDSTSAASMSVITAPSLSLALSEERAHGLLLSAARVSQELDTAAGRRSVLNAGGEAISPAQTPQASPSHGTSAAMNRAHGLSSVARRMDRLEIRSPDVETHAAQVYICIYVLRCLLLL